jgi:hypothetical protein
MMKGGVMGMIRLATAAVFLSLACGCNVAAAAEEIDTAAGMAAINEWVAGIDRGAYGEGWDRAAQRLRESIERARWEALIEGARRPLGNMIARKLRTATFARSLPNAPEGEYVVIQYDTAFEKAPLASETVTSEREKDGAWRVSGYWIR